MLWKKGIQLGVFLVLFLAGWKLASYRRPLPTQFLSPLPSVKTEEADGEVPQSQAVAAALSEASKVWHPDATKIFKNAAVVAEEPAMNGTSALVVDATTEKVLFAHEPKRRQQVASTVKIMTAVVVLDHASPDKVLSVSSQAVKRTEASGNLMGVSAGEKYTVKDLLYGLMLPSGNDAAETLAEGLAGSRQKFVEWMNLKAKFLGMADTRFADPSGLADPGDEDQYSSAYDLVVLTYYALNKYPLFKEIVGTEEYQIAATGGHKDIYLRNMTNLLDTYPGVYGVKPGYNDFSGLCLVTACRNGGYDLLAVVLGSNDRRGDMRALLDYSFAQLGVTVAVE